MSLGGSDGPRHLAKIETGALFLGDALERPVGVTPALAARVAFDRVRDVTREGAIDEGAVFHFFLRRVHGLGEFAGPRDFIGPRRAVGKTVFVEVADPHIDPAAFPAGSIGLVHPDGVEPEVFRGKIARRPADEAERTVPREPVEHRDRSDRQSLDPARVGGRELEIREQGREPYIGPGEKGNCDAHRMRPGVTAVESSAFGSELVSMMSPEAPSVKRTAVFSSPSPVSRTVS